MPSGRDWYGPGFWKRDTNWVPGSGGFRGGADRKDGPGAFPPRRWLRCYRYDAGYAPYPPWMMEPKPEEEAHFLKEQADAIRGELAGIEQRLAELEQDQQK